MTRPMQSWYLKITRKKRGVRNLLHRCETTGNGYVSVPDTTGGSERTT